MGEGRPGRRRLDLRVARRVAACDGALPARLVQHGPFVIDVAREEDRAGAALQAAGLKSGRPCSSRSSPVRARFERREIRRPAAAARTRAKDPEPVVPSPPRQCRRTPSPSGSAPVTSARDAGRRRDRSGRGLGGDLRVAQPATAADGSNSGPDPEPAHRLGEFEADRTGAEHREGSRAGPRSRTPCRWSAPGRPPGARRRHARARPGRHHDGAGADRVWSSTRSVVVSANRAVPAMRSCAGTASTPFSTAGATKRSRSRRTRLSTAAPSTRMPATSTPNRPARRHRGRARAAAMSSFDGMQPTRAQVVPPGPPSIRTWRLPPGSRRRARGETRGPGADHRHVATDVLHGWVSWEGGGEGEGVNAAIARAGTPSAGRVPGGGRAGGTIVPQEGTATLRGVGACQN